MEPKRKTQTITFLLKFTTYLFSVCKIKNNVTATHRHQPAGGKNHPISPAFPPLKHKKRQGHRPTAVGSQSWRKIPVREKKNSS